MESELSFRGGVLIIKKRLIPLMIVFFIALFVSVVFTTKWFYQPKYSSHAILYPVNLVIYSDESESEQMVQILKSEYIYKAIRQEYGLKELFNEDGRDNELKLREYYNRCFSFRLTQYNSVEIKVKDADAEIAKQMVESIIGFYNQKVREMHRSKTGEYILTLEQSLISYESQIKELDEKVDSLRSNFGMLDYEIQVEKLTEALSFSGASSRKQKELNKQLVMVRENGGMFKKYNAELDNLRGQYINTKNTLQKVIEEHEKTITYGVVVSKPYVSYKKEFPTRIWIILFSTISTLILAISVIGFIEKGRMYD